MDLPPPRGGGDAPWRVKRPLGPPLKVEWVQEEEHAAPVPHWEAPSSYKGGVEG